MEYIVEKAKEYCLDEFSNYNGKLGCDFIIAMTLEMEKMVIKKIETDTTLNDSALLLGIYFHDLGRIIDDGDEHPKHSANLFKTFINKNPVSDEIKTIVLDCCINHGSNSKPETKEGKIIQIFDKEVAMRPKLIRAFLLQELKKDGDYNEILKKIGNKLKKWHSKIPSQDVREKYEIQLELLLDLFLEDEIQ